MILNIIDEGIKDYEEMLTKQRTIFASMVEQKKNGIPIEKEYLFFVEHPSVITLGKHAKESNILINKEELLRHGISIHHIERGGDVTFHSPGQLVAYPLIDLESHHIGVKDYVNILEESVIRTLSHLGIKGERVSGASGVWIDAGTDKERKICALGVKCSRFVTMHGLALNVNNNLNGFHLINPCGFIDKGVTSIAKELNKNVNINIIKSELADHFKELINKTYKIYHFFD